MIPRPLLSLALACPLALAVLPRAHAEEHTGVVVQAPERPNSVNLSPLGVLFGSYNVNYERLFGSHGLLVEAGFSHASDDNNESNNFGGAVGYRWHWRGRQNSGFLGLTASFFDGSGTGTVTSGTMEKSFDLAVKSYALTANIGKRWAWDNGLNATFRIGGGYGKYDISTDSTDPDAKKATESLHDLLELIPIALEGELSLGYDF